MRYEYAVIITRFDAERSDDPLTILDKYISADQVIEFMTMYPVETPSTVAVEEEVGPVEKYDTPLPGSVSEAAREVGHFEVIGVGVSKRPGRKQPRQKVCKNCGKAGHMAKTCQDTVEGGVGDPNYNRVYLLVEEGLDDSQIYNKMHDYMTDGELSIAIKRARESVKIN